MKKYIPFLLGFFIGVLPMHATEVFQNDTTVRFNKKIIQLEDSIGQIKVKVYDNDSTAFKPIYEGIFSDGKSYEKWTVMEAIGIQLPFLNKKNEKHHRNYSMKPHWAGIGWGFANISDQNYKLNNISGVSLKSESSNEFFINPIQKIMPLFRNNLGLTSGIGFDWHNYFLDMNTHLVDANGVTTLENAPAGTTYEYSRLRTFHITVPLLLEWQPTFGNNHKFYMAAGAIGGVNTFASYRIRYKDANGNMIENVEGKGLNVAPLSLDFLGEIGYGSWTVYAKYSPFGIFQSAKGPNVRAVSFGAKLNF
jgi:hypothetical protein